MEVMVCDTADNYIEVCNKNQLIAAVKACLNDSRTYIINKRKGGGRTTIKIGPFGFKGYNTFKFEQHLKTILRRIRETPAHVWR